MEKELQDDLKLVAEFDDHRPSIIADWDFYQSSWNMQIPVWAKLYKTYRDGEVRLTVDEVWNYQMAVNTNNPRAGFDIIVDIIKRIKQ